MSFDNKTLTDQGKQPYVINTEMAAKLNNDYRRAIWTGKHLQVTLMSINPNDDIGLEVHPDNDQLLFIEQGQAIILMGATKDNLNYRKIVNPQDAIFVPAGFWHNIINNSINSLKIFTVYAPPHHPFQTVHQTKEIAMKHDNDY